MQHRLSTLLIVLMSGFASAGEPIPTPVDSILTSAWAEKNVQPVPICNDEQYLRRITLDLAGRIATVEERTAFLENPDRQGLIERLLSSTEFPAFWGELWTTHLFGYEADNADRDTLAQWLQAQFRTNRPYDQIVEELLTSTGESAFNGPVNFLLRYPDEPVVKVSRAFLGVRLDCARCHDHPFDRWTQADFKRMNRFFEATERQDVSARNVRLVDVVPDVNADDRPRFLTGAEPRTTRWRAEFALFLTRSRPFARNFVNRMWYHFLGRGIVHPVDAMQSQPWNQDLLDVLANRLVESKYDLKAVLEFIATSQAYQSRAEVLARDAEDKDYVYRGPRAKRLTAEQFVDAVWRLTGTTPAKIELKVPRANPTAASAKKPVIEPLVAAPIWSGDIAGGRLPAAGEMRSFRHQLVLAADVDLATCVITCDNGFDLYVNGKKIGSGDNWADPKSFDLSSALLKGANQFVIVGSNAGSSPNIAALFFQVNVSLKGGARVRMATDASWEWTKSVPNARGTFAAAGKAKAATKAAEVVWQPVSLVKSEAWRKAEVRMAEMLAGVDGTSSLPARASLMKSDMLQRALGRPNREQIVSMRPNELSTLEAIDLSNGQALTNLLATGAAKLKKRSWSSPEDLTRWLYVSALSREPAPAELKVAAGMVGPDLSEQGIADLLWAVCMLPEFQTIR